MGKYSEPATFAGKTGRNTAQQPKTDWSKEIDERIDIVAAMWEHASIDLSKSKGSRRQLNAKCPYPDCSSKEDAFIVWPNRSPKSRNHFHCRKCDRSGDIIKLLEDINGWTFAEVLDKLGLLGDEPRIIHRTSPAQERQAKIEQYLAEQLAMLRHLYPRMQEWLTMERPQAYLASRGISLEQARAHGLGYFPSPQETGKPPDKDLWQWQGRIIFPLTGPEVEGLTFAGRALGLWQPGMTPDQHKVAIDTWNAQFERNDKHRVTRTHNTSPCGHFGFREAVMGRMDVTLVEGEFDALSLMVSRVEGVIAIGGNGFDPHLLPLNIGTVYLALDADTAGQQAMQRLAADLAAVGLDTVQIAPVDDKDWNDMLIAGKSEQIRNLFAVGTDALCVSCLDEGQEVQATCEFDDLMYCRLHWPGEKSA